MAIVFLIGVIFYCIGEGVTEGWTWLANDTFEEINARVYHIYRFFLETLGIVIMILFNDGFAWYIYLISFAIGISIYEMMFSTIVYENPLYNKTSKWFGIPHPPGWFWLVLLFVGFSMMIVLQII